MVWFVVGSSVLGQSPAVEQMCTGTSHCEWSQVVAVQAGLLVGKRGHTLCNSLLNHRELLCSDRLFTLTL